MGGKATLIQCSTKGKLTRIIKFSVCFSRVDGYYFFPRDFLIFQEIAKGEGAR